MSDAPAPTKLVGVRVTAFVMVMGGLLLASVTIPSIRTSGHPEVAFIAIYFTIWVFFLGIGLERRSSWAWEGTVYMAALWVFAFLLIPSAVLSARNAKLSTSIAFFVIGALFAIPALLLLKYLLRPNTRKAFDTQPISAGTVPTVWIRLIAIGTLIGSGTGLMELFHSTPNPLFGVFDNRIALFTFQVTTLVVAIYSGLRLYHLEEFARRVTIALLILCQVQYIMWSLLAPAPMGRFTAFRICTSFLTTALAFTQIWYLHTRRHLFFAR